MYNNINETYKSVTQPINLNIELLEHQKKAVHAMLELENIGYVDIKNFLYSDNVEKDLRIDTRIGILGDIVGSGKSLMIVTLILYKKFNNKCKDIYYSSDKYVNIKSLSDQYIYSKCNLLIIPIHLTTQWSNFFQFAPSIKVIVLNKNIIPLQELDTYDVCIIPVTFIEDLLKIYNKIIWNRIIIDEADSIKMPDIDLLSNFIWLITGTPSGISISKKKYIKNIFGKNINWLTDIITVKNNNKYVEQSLKLPTAKRIIIKCFTPPELTLLKEFIPTSIIQMINAGNTDDAIKTLNYHIDTKDNIFKVICKTIENSIFNKSEEIESEKKKKYIEGSYNHIESIKKIKYIETAINKLKSRLNTIKIKIKESGEAICPICMGEIEERMTMVDCCGTFFCFECLSITSAGKSKCPYCQQQIDKKSIHIIDDNKKKIYIHDLQDKIDVLMKIISKPNAKILIFADFQKTFDKIKYKLEHEKISYNILKGCENTINNIINNFKQGNTKILMLNATNFGAGLNLQEATDIIIYHRFTTEIEEQVIGRAQRLGRTTILNVYYLIHDNEENSFNDIIPFDDINYDDYLAQL